MIDLIQNLGEPWAIRALVTSALVGVMCGVIGVFIVLRNMSLIGDALSHAILPGIFVAFIIVGYSTIGFFIGSVIAGLLTAFLITWIQQHIKTRNDAAIGIVFTCMFSIGVIGISWLNTDQGAHLDMQDFLFGKILGISNEDIVITALITVYAIASIIVFYRYLFITTFQPTIAKTMGVSVKMVHYFLMLLLSFAVVAALRSVGVILVVAMLITPASTALLLSDQLKRVLVLAGFLGLLSAFLGLVFAILWNLPPGPSMVCVSTTIYLLVALFAPQKGMIVQRMRAFRQKMRIAKEDVLRLAIKSHPQSLPIAEVYQSLGFSKSFAKSIIRSLRSEGLIFSEGEIKLSAKGEIEANALVRAHRLWEAYQVNSMGLSEGQIHDEADRLEHYLTDDLLDEVDSKLGFPDMDPHGSPIPKKPKLKGKTIMYVKMGDRFRISEDQKNEEIESALWELKILPGSLWSIKRITNNEVTLKSGNRTIQMSAQLAEQVIVL